MSALFENHEWINQESAFPVCITHLADAFLNDILSKLKCDPQRVELLDFEAAGRLQDFESARFVVQTDGDGASVLLVEPNGFLGSIPTIAASLSSVSTRMVSIFWNIERVMQVTVAHNGRLVRMFDPLLYELNGNGVYGDPLSEEIDLPFGDPETSGSSMLRLFERITGFDITAEWAYRHRRNTYPVGLAISEISGR